MHDPKRKRRATTIDVINLDPESILTGCTLYQSATSESLTVTVRRVASTQARLYLVYPPTPHHHRSSLYPLLYPSHLSSDRARAAAAVHYAAKTVENTAQGRFDAGRS